MRGVGRHGDAAATRSGSRRHPAGPAAGAPLSESGPALSLAGADGTRVLAPFEPTATRVAPTGTLYLRSGRDLRVFQQSPISIGRAADCDFVIDHPELPPYALRLHCGPGGVWIEHLDSTNGGRPGIPRRLPLPSDLHLARGLVLRIGNEPPAARSRRLPILVVLGGLLLFGFQQLGGTPQPPSPPTPIAAPAGRASDPASAPVPRPEAAHAPAPVARPVPAALLPPRPAPADRRAAAPATDRPQPGPAAPADASDREDVRRVEQAAFWIARGLPHRARPLLDVLPADPVLAKRALSSRAELRRQAEELRVQARAMTAIDPDAAQTLRRQAAALLFPDDPLHRVLERELR